MADLKRVALVTGATSGIGVDLARDLLDKGWRVALVGRRIELGEQLAAELGESSRFFPGDQGNYESLASAFAAVWAAWGRLDAVCLNAGIVDKSSVYILKWRGKAVDDVPPAPDLSTTDVDYKGVVYGTQLATHYMRHNAPSPGGRVVVTASIAALFPHRSYPEYCGAKAAVVQYVRAVAPLLLAKDHVEVNCVLPGIIATPIVPPEMINAVSPECITPVDTVLRAYHTFLDAAEPLAGQIVEASADQLIYYDLPEEGNGAVTRRAVAVWEPLFEMMHGEKSELPDAIP
ncbi:uncharacterized protein K452DRAFT_308321 [Aplosporella prunicola CBS 121167]|uniref:15-hydroxyprostaglandin dehydrogenase (NAD(+)) n=1 Tax=Aplosporella prunicola CBS 121167 TaxID=1176127 RepID=A0A6A6BJD5_9PEZI|nr:uncharacterized protein K452DRAFT_308321 [Aplosporella prunicola CBS 121167]KAF2142681.1 hypothetical protein K452DRAFT_308321 [Aplosporella prunicola CBS 121167]